MSTSGPFDVAGLLAKRGGERYELAREYLNPQLARTLHAIGFDKVYTRGEGCYFFDEDDQQYLDMLAGFGVFAVGRNHPVIRQALHDVLDLGLADLTQFDAPPLAGLLGEQLLARAPHLDRVYFSNSGTESVEAALKFARYATGRPRIIYCEHAFHGLTVGSLSVNGAEEFRAGFDPLLPDTCDPLRRPGRPRARAAPRRRRRFRDRADPGQARGRLAAGVPGRRAGAAGPARGAVDPRRGPDRRGAHGGVLRLPARRRRAGHRRDREGPVGRVHPDRRDHGAGLDLPEGLLLDGPRPGPRLDLRFERAGDDRGPGDPPRRRRRRTWSTTRG